MTELMLSKETIRRMTDRTEGNAARENDQAQATDLTCPDSCGPDCWSLIEPTNPFCRPASA